MAGIDLEIRMTIKTLAERGTSCAEIGRLLKLPESNVRYHLHRIRSGAGDGRALRPRRAAAVAEAIEHWMHQHDGSPQNLAALHDWLVAEHDYPGTLRSVQRFVADRYGRPPRRARRRVETPPGTQAQLDWAIFPGVSVGGERRELSALLLSLSYSRHCALWWSVRRDQLSWLSGHNELLRRIGGVPAVIRIDNDTAAVAHGAGPWGTLSEPYRRYALTVRFHVDLCLPRQPQTKGKIERRVRASRSRVDPMREHWRDLAELPPHLADMAAFTLATGLRRANVTGLQWSQVDLDRKLAWIHPDQAKARRAISVPLNAEAVALVSKQLGKHATHVFTFRGKPITQVRTTSWYAALERAGVDDFRWHDLRHTWASWHVQSGTPLFALQEMGGWESPEMVWRYAHLAADHLAPYADRLVPLGVTDESARGTNPSQGQKGEGATLR